MDTDPRWALEVLAPVDTGDDFADFGEFWTLVRRLLPTPTIPAGVYAAGAVEMNPCGAVSVVVGSEPYRHGGVQSLAIGLRPGEFRWLSVEGAVEAAHRARIGEQRSPSVPAYTPVMELHYLAADEGEG